MTDRELLRSYLDDRSETAFRELVERHLPMVHATALRKANGDAHLAHDVAQRAFVALFTKARSLSDRENLAGWLHTAANFEATRLVRSEIRRRKREEIADTMDDTKAAGDSTKVWKQLAPAIDGVVSGLPDKDRESVVLRFFSGKTYAEIGAIVGTTEESARKRVERALGTLRQALRRRGVESTAALLATALEIHAASLAPSTPTLGITDAVWKSVSMSPVAQTAAYRTFFGLDYDAFETVEKTQNQHICASDIASAIVGSGASLDGNQIDALTASLVSHSITPDADTPQGGCDWDAISADAKQLLNQEQYAAFEQAAAKERAYQRVSALRRQSQR